LLCLCEKHKVIIVEDNIEEEMKYFGKVHLPIKSIDTHGGVIYLGSFSKILAPGFRLGWIIADEECIKRLTTLKTIFDLSSNTFSQIMLHESARMATTSFISASF
jgi:2-aminoadipate transaminase